MVEELVWVILGTIITPIAADFEVCFSGSILLETFDIEVLSYDGTLLGQPAGSEVLVGHVESAASDGGIQLLLKLDPGWAIRP